MDGFTDSEGKHLNKLREMAKGREAWRAAVQGVTKNQTQKQTGEYRQSWQRDESEPRDGQDTPCGPVGEGGAWVKWTGWV